MSFDDDSEKRNNKLRRNCLPHAMVSRNEYSLWSILKHCIGKELSKITMPAIFNEPTSFIQRVAENVEYAQLLTEADLNDDPVERMELVAAFAVSAGAYNWERLNKPFNPLLGETYELMREDLGFRFICEQVSHHPPVSAYFTDSNHFQITGCVHPKLRFWGKSVEVKPEGLIRLKLLRHNETYTWRNVNICVHNIIVGKLWFEQYGNMDIINHSNGLKASLCFKAAGWFGKDLHRFEGFIYSKDKAKLRFLYGKWTDYTKSASVDDYEEYMRQNEHKFRVPDKVVTDGHSPVRGNSPASTPKKVMSKLNSLTRSLTGSSSSLDVPDQSTVDGNISPVHEPECNNGDIPKSDSAYSLDIPNSQLLWHVLPRPENSADYYHFTSYTMTLNEIDDEMKKILPKTDSRLRPDIRLLEEGDLDGASREKNRLEEKQRDARKHRKKKHDQWAPLWFKLAMCEVTKEETWTYTNSYWDRSFANCPDIF